ncbi:MAG: hypothetical protein IPO28_13605 [Holophagaceae bacterium]|nr:hypothetical protein [Holophagaceae bacterium]
MTEKSSSAAGPGCGGRLAGSPWWRPGTRRAPRPFCAWAPRGCAGANLKADLPPCGPCRTTAALRSGWAGDPVLVAGNTLEGEEELILGVWSTVRTEVPGLRLILAPRQPRRFDAVAAELAAQGLPHRRASRSWPDEDAWRGTRVLLLDTLGDLASAYAEGTLALVAGAAIPGGTIHSSRCRRAFRP